MFSGFIVKNKKKQRTEINQIIQNKLNNLDKNE